MKDKMRKYQTDTLGMPALKLLLAESVDDKGSPDKRSSKTQSGQDPERAKHSAVLRLIEFLQEK